MDAGLCGFVFLFGRGSSIRLLAYFNAWYNFQAQNEVASTVTNRWLNITNLLPVCTSTTGVEAPSGIGIFIRFFRFRST
uniref:Putative secreted protein n=1 Tax=Anopheles darlingi TaxID=43151 RepID=A0A2M4D0V7_ANODA